MRAGLTSGSVETKTPGVQHARRSGGSEPEGLDAGVRVGNAAHDDLAGGERDEIVLDACHGDLEEGEVERDLERSVLAEELVDLENSHGAGKLEDEGRTSRGSEG